MAKEQAIHGCLFCPQTFDTASAKDDHILEHFVQESCVECNRNLIRIGGSLYTRHDESTCIKRIVKTEEHIESCFTETLTLQNDTECLSETDDPYYDDASSWIDDDQAKIKHQNTIKDLSYSPDYQRYCIPRDNSIPVASLQTFSFADAHIKTELIEQNNEQLVNMAKNPSNEKTACDHTKQMARSDVRCDLCNKSYDTNYSYQEHMQLEHDQNIRKSKQNKKVVEKMACDFCGKLFVQKASLEKHINRMHSSTNTVDKISNNRFDNQQERDSFKAESKVKSSVAKAEETGNHQPSGCDICGRQMRSVYTLKKHKILFHSLPGTIFCDVCAKVFSMVDERDKHQAQCKLKRKLGTLRLSGSFECDICKKIFKTKRALRRHMQVKHIPGGDRLKCKSCKCIFLKESTLQKHKCKGKNTSYRDLIPCENCGKIITRGSIYAHRIAFHSPPGTLYCRVCFKIFCNDDELSAHRLSLCKKNQLSGPRPCDVCGKILSGVSGVLARHKIVFHSTGTIFCRKCVKKFKTVEELNAHLPECTLKRKLRKHKKRDQLLTKEKTEQMQ